MIIWSNFQQNRGRSDRTLDYRTGAGPRRRRPPRLRDHPPRPRPDGRRRRAGEGPGRDRRQRRRRDRRHAGAASVVSGGVIRIEAGSLAAAKEANWSTRGSGRPSGRPRRRRRGPLAGDEIIAFARKFAADQVELARSQARCGNQGAEAHFFVAQREERIALIVWSNFQEILRPTCLNA